MTRTDAVLTARLGAGVFSMLAAAGSAWAGGYLWMGAEFAAEGDIFRYHIDAGMIDLTISPPLPGGAAHWNNMATDCATVYIGNPTTQYMGLVDAYTGEVLGSVTYTPSAAGHKEDGAYHAAAGTLWRVTFSGHMHEITKSGAVLNTWTGVGALVGLEWVGETLYATNYSGGDVGEIVFTGPTTATFNIIPWSAGGAPASGTMGALAWDDDDDVLYLVTYNDDRLYRVTFDQGEATATLVVDLNDVGLPSGVLVDGMGWVRPEPPCAHDLNGDGAVGPPDLANLLDHWGPNPGHPADFNCDGVVGPPDLAKLLDNWGACK